MTEVFIDILLLLFLLKLSLACVQVYQPLLSISFCIKKIKYCALAKQKYNAAVAKRQAKQHIKNGSQWGYQGQSRDWFIFLQKLFGSVLLHFKIYVFSREVITLLVKYICAL